MQTFSAAVLIALALTSLAGFALGQKNLDSCPQISEEVKPVSFKKTLGVWYSIRLGPPCMETTDGKDATPDCLAETYWVDEETPEGVANVALRFKDKHNGTIGTTSGKINTTVDYSNRTDLPKSNTWEFTMFGMSSPVVFLDSDEGKSWAIGYSCWEFGPKNNTAHWFIVSRLPYMDPKLEQTLVRRIKKLSPTVTEDELIGIGHSDCY